jgi:hypothetical protein
LLICAYLLQYCRFSCSCRIPGVTKKEKAAGVKREVDDVRKYVVRRVIDRSAKNKKTIQKVPAQFAAAIIVRSL